MTIQTNSGIEIWDRIPGWLQWILYIPIVFIIPLITNYVLILIGDFEGVFLYFQIAFNSGLFAFLFTWLAINLAPKDKKISAWLLYSAWSVFVVLTITRCIHTWFWTEYGFTNDTILEFLQSIVWLMVGIPCLLYFGKSNNIRSEVTLKKIIAYFIGLLGFLMQGGAVVGLPVYVLFFGGSSLWLLAFFPLGFAGMVPLTVMQNMLNNEE